jgi:hypothetical protein
MISVHVCSYLAYCLAHNVLKIYMLFNKPSYFSNLSVLSCKALQLILLVLEPFCSSFPSSGVVEEGSMSQTSAIQC